MFGGTQSLAVSSKHLVASCIVGLVMLAYGRNAWQFYSSWTHLAAAAAFRIQQFAQLLLAVPKATVLDGHKYALYCYADTCWAAYVVGC